MKITNLLYQTDKTKNELNSIAKTDIELIREIVLTTVVLPFDFSHIDVTLINPEKRWYRVNVRRKDIFSKNSLVSHSYFVEKKMDGFTFSPSIDSMPMKNKFKRDEV